jgi:hypothetical protein
MDALGTVFAIGFVAAVVAIAAWLFLIAPFVVPRRVARR